MELKPPPPPDDTPPDGAWSPLLDELLFDELPFVELLLDPFDELLDEPVDPLELVPEFDVPDFDVPDFDVPEDELELDEDLLPVLVAAWLDPGSTTATTPAMALAAAASRCRSVAPKRGG